MKSIIEAASKCLEKNIMQSLANGNGPLADGAGKNLKMQDKRQRQTRGSVHRSMKDCIKPGNVIDDDVKDCIGGLKKKAGS